jgi:16S rRNA (cytosine1402-N4)-methyltransferase
MADRTNSGSCHQPVLVGRVVELLVTDPLGAYLDLTAGGGGHLKALAGRLGSTARLYGTDADPAAIERTTKVLEGVSQFRKLIRTRFGDIADAAKSFDDREFDGILLDLGISSDQLDDPDRGISFRLDGPLDMRLDPTRGVPASHLISTLSEQELKGIIGQFGEERKAGQIARAIVRERQRSMILTTAQLKDVVVAVVAEPHRTKSLARVFQAFRIAVNRELDELAAVLPQASDLLKPGGRLAVISYHSLEDRLVKRFMQTQAKGDCHCPRELPMCVCGAKPTLTIVTRHAVVPDDAEVSGNPRARSARLRVAERLPR